MRLPFEILLALRYLRPKRTFFSAITFISVVGVMLGVSVLIVVMSVMTGFDHELRDKFLSINAPIRIQLANRKPLTDYQTVVQEVRRNPSVLGAAPFVVLPTMALVQNRAEPAFANPLICGVDPQYETNVSKLLQSLQEGEADLRGNGILIGSEMALDYGLEVGDNLAIFSIRSMQKLGDVLRQKNDQGESSSYHTPGEFQIRGIFKLDFYEFDQRLIVCSLANAQDLLGYKDEVQGLNVQLQDPEAANAVRETLKSQLGPAYSLSTWEEETRVQEFLAALHVEKNVMFYLLFFIMVVAAFGITSVLITFVVQKTREIGMLNALGASRRQIMSIFLTQSFLVGLLGVALGLGLGLAAVWYRNEFLFFLRRVTGFELFPRKIYNFSELPALIVTSDVAFICGGSLLICLLAGVLPAWNAARLRPVDALRHE